MKTRTNFAFIALLSFYGNVYGQQEMYYNFIINAHTQTSPVAYLRFNCTVTLYDPYLGTESFSASGYVGYNGTTTITVEANLQN